MQTPSAGENVYVKSPIVWITASNSTIMKLHDVVAVIDRHTAVNVMRNGMDLEHGELRRLKGMCYRLWFRFHSMATH